MNDDLILRFEKIEQELQRQKKEAHRLPEIYLVDFKNKMSIKLTDEAYTKQKTIKRFVWNNLRCNGIVK